ncbi:MAG: copper resistance protein CopC [Chthoniobacterales bacterium]|nr:copper resistance protein CopC [Chthoniobacterales bacterium]
MSHLSALAAALTLLALQTSALAHSTLDRSEPKDGAILKELPNEIRIWFTEPIKVGLSTVEARNEAGHQIDRQDLRADKKEPVLVSLSLLPNLGVGTYRVSWTAVAQDMHVSKGSYSFRITP